MKSENLEGVRKLIEEQEGEGSTLVGLLFVMKKDKGSSGWTLVFPEGISPEFQAHVLECFKIDPAKVHVSHTPPPTPKPFSQDEDEIAYGAEDHEEDEEEEEEDNGFHTKHRGDS